jgi:O-antigen/teichoic acid export membrane protein
MPLAADVETDLAVLDAPGVAGPASATRVSFSSLAQVTRQSAVNMIGGVVSQGLKFLVVIYVARRFSTAEFGLFAFAWSIQAFMFVTSHFGLPTYGTREIARSGRIPARLLADVAVGRAGLALAGTLVAIGLLLAVPRVSQAELFLVATFGLSNVAQAFLFDWVFQGLQRLESSAAINILWQALWLVFTWLGVRLGGDVRTVGVALLLATVLASLAGYLWLRWTSGVESYERVSGLFRDSWTTLNSGAALGIGTVLINVLVWTDTITVRLLRGEEAVGIYAAGNRAALALSMLATFYIQGAFPMLSRASVEGSGKFEQSFQQTCHDLALLFLPGSFFAIAYAREIIQLIFGHPEYLTAVPIFQIFQVVLLMLIANSLLGTGVLVAFHRDNSFRAVLIATVVAFLVVCPLLTAYWGILGAASAMLICQTISLAGFVTLSRSHVRVHHAGALLRPVLAGVVALAVSRFLHLSLLGAAISLLLAYAALLTARGQFTPERTAAW